MISPQDSLTQPLPSVTPQTITIYISPVDDYRLMDTTTGPDTSHQALTWHPEPYGIPICVEQSTDFSYRARKPGDRKKVGKEVGKKEWIIQRKRCP